MHILIIPSEEFVPDYNKLDGIFQYHQALILREAGYKMGVLSVRLSFSLPMIIKGIFYKVFGQDAGNATDDLSIMALVKLGVKRFFSPQKFVSVEDKDGIIVYRIEGLYKKRPANNKNHISWVKAGLICFQEYIKKEGIPDLIHAHDAIYAGMLAEKIHRKFGLQYIITEHSSTYALNKADKEVIDAVRNAHKHAKALYAVSESFAGLLNNLFSFDRFSYLPNVLDQYLENYIKAKKNGTISKTNGGFIFLHIAVFKPVKDQQTLIRAFKKLLDLNRHAELWIGGAGDLENDLVMLVKKLGIEQRVRFLGLLDRDGVIKHLKECDCFVLSSKYETFGVVTIEAMLFGKPVIVTRVGVGPTIVTEKNGFVVDVGSEEQLADAMLKMIGSSEKYNSDEISRLAIDNFGRESFLKRMNKIYNDAAMISASKV